VLNLKREPLINTKIDYHVIKFINPNGISNFFIKISTAIRRQTVSGLDPSILKNGTYTWQVPIFTAGNESNTVDNKGSSMQFMQIGSGGGQAVTMICIGSQYNP
jgi:hypothetical protein